MNGLARFEAGAGHALDPVVSAAVLAFGLVYVHPFEDGNGRLHRYAIHHVLAKFGFNPPDIVFPVSAVLLERIADYRRVLETYSSRLLRCIRWEATSAGNVRVLDETADFYRYFDATPHAEFLYGCVARAIDETLPREADFLCRYDRFRDGIMTVVEMPDRLVDLLFRVLNQNRGRLSRRARENDFAALEPWEVVRIEAIFRTCFADEASGEAE